LNYTTKTLPNGLRVMHLPIDSPVSHVALFINAGTRDEEHDENGLAHFIEHTIFKGTRKRRAYHILTRLESVGGELNAYTTKEETCIYATVLNEHLPRALELISDIILNSTFPAKELKKEKEVILDEINSYKDSPAEEIYDVFEENLFCGHPLAMNILGTPEHLKEFSQDHVSRFMSKNYHGGNMAMSIIGMASFDRVYPAVTRYFSPVPGKGGSNDRRPFGQGKPFRLYMDRSTWQTHTILGSLAYNRRDERRIAMFLLNNLLGGPALNSRLNLAVRERYGYTYNIESVYMPYTDTGVFSIYMGTDNGNLEKALALVEKELEKVRNVPLGTLQLQQAKKQLIGQIAIANESNLNRMLAAGKTFLHDDQADTMEETGEKIEAVTRDEILDVANEVLAPEGLSLLVFQSSPDPTTP
jgi:predicted Zn-dependent peptidase